MKALKLTIFLATVAAAQQLGSLPSANNIAVNNPGELGLVSPQRSSQITGVSPSTLAPNPIVHNPNTALIRPYHQPTAYFLYNQQYGAGVIPTLAPSRALVGPTQHPFVPSYAHLIANNPYQMISNVVSRNDLPIEQLAFNDLYHQGYIKPELLAEYKESSAQPLERPPSPTNEQDRKQGYRRPPDYRTKPRLHEYPALKIHQEYDRHNFEQKPRETLKQSLHPQTNNRTGRQYSDRPYKDHFENSSPTRRTFTDAVRKFSYRPIITSTPRPIVKEEHSKYDGSHEPKDSDYDHRYRSPKHDFGRKIAANEKSWDVDTRSFSAKQAPVSPLYSLSYLTPEDIATHAPPSRGGDLLTVANDPLKSEFFRYPNMDDFGPQLNLAKHLPPYYLPYSPLTEDYRPTPGIYIDQTKPHDPPFEYYGSRNPYSQNHYAVDGYTRAIDTEPLTNVYDIYTPTYKEGIIPPYRPIPIVYDDTVYEKQPKETWNDSPSHYQTLSIQEQLDSFYRDENQNQNNLPPYINEPIFPQDIGLHNHFPQHGILRTTHPSTTERPVLQAVSPHFNTEAEFYSTTPFPPQASTKEYLNAWPITPPPSFFPDRSKHSTAPPDTRTTTSQNSNSDEISGHRKIIESSPDFQHQVSKPQKQAYEPKLRPYVPQQRQAPQTYKETAKEFMVGIPPIPPNLPLVYHPKIFQNNFELPFMNTQWTPSKELNAYKNTDHPSNCKEHPPRQRGHVETESSTENLYETTTKKSSVYFSPYASLAPPVTPHSLRLGKTNFHDREENFNGSPDESAVSQAPFIPIPIKSYSKYVPIVPRNYELSQTTPNEDNDFRRQDYRTRAFIPPYNTPVSDIYSSRRNLQGKLPYLPRRSRLRRRPLWFGLVREAARENQKSSANSQDRVLLPAPDHYSTLRRNGVRETETEIHPKIDSIENASTFETKPLSEHARTDEYRRASYENLDRESTEIIISETVPSEAPEVSSTSPRLAAEEKIHHLRQHQKILQNTKLRPPLEEMKSRSSDTAAAPSRKRRLLSNSIKRRKARNKRRRKEGDDPSTTVNDATSQERHAKRRMKYRRKVARENKARLPRSTTQEPQSEATASAATTLSDGLRLQHIYAPFLEQLRAWDAQHG